ncbi:MAG: PEGA domain-containing protein [Candidatus Micrarchaeota archaeon]
MNQTLQSLVLITLSFFLLFGCTSQSLNTNGSSTNSDASAMNTLGRLPADANAADLLNQFNPSPDQTSLVVIVLPLGANLTVTPIGGTPYSGVSPLYLSNISAGRYNIMASAPGYNNHGTFFTVIENESNLFSMNLTPSLGASVSVETTPSGASITLTGGPSVLSGTSPANFSNLSAGIYQLHITLSGYDNLSGILIVGDGQDQSLSYNLTAANLTSPHATSLEVNVVPVGAHVLASKLNSSENIHYEGTAPLVVSDSEPGRYMIMASATGYQTHGTFFDVLANQDNVFNMTLNALPPQLSLTVNADPAGANVTVSLAGTTTNYLGNAPFSLTNLSAGNYSVQVSAIGYRANITSVELLENQTLDLTLYPFAGASNLTVNTVPGGANVSVRSMKNQSLVYSGISPFTVTDLSVFGTYIISATLPGYADYVSTPPIWDNQSYVFNYTLQPLGG